MVTRYERVVLSLEDRFSREIAQAAVATKTFERTLRDLDGTSTRTRSSVTGLEKPVSNVDRSSRLADRSINQLTGRLRLLTDVALTLGPALVPLGGAGVAAIAGLTAQFGALAGGIGVSIVALNGIGDALGAVNDYQLDPTADNLAKVAAEFERIGPAGAEFVLFLESISPQLREMQMLAREGFLPGLAEGIDAFLSRGTQLNNIVSDLAVSLGDLSGSAGQALGGDRFDAFFDYLDREAGPLLLEFGRSIGFVAEGLANMLVAFAPASSDFSSGLEDMTRRFAEWSAGLQDNDSFREFIDYIRQNGPAAIDFLGSLVDALAGIVEAAAPVGQAILPALTALLDVFAGIAGSPIGSALLAAAAGFIALNRASKGLEFIGTKFDALTSSLAGVEAGSGKAASGMSKLSKAAGIAGLAIGALAVVSEIQESFDGLGTGVEQLTGQLLDLAASDGAARLTGEFSDLESSLDRFTDPNFAQAFQTSVTSFLGAESWDSSEVNKARAQFELLDEALINIVATGGPELAQASFEGLVDSLGITEGQIDRLRGVLPGYKDALAGAENEAKLAGDAHNDLAGDLDDASSSVDRLQNRLKAARTQLKESRQGAREVAQSFVGLGDSLNNSEKSLGDWLGELERNAEALRRFQANAERAGRRGLDEGLVESLRNAGSEGALRMRQLANATDEEIARANKAWRNGQGAVKDFVNEVGGVKPKYVTRLEARVEQALAELARLKAALNIPDETVNVWVTRRTVDLTNPSGMGPQPSADGGTVPKTGRGYADRHLYLLADGEEVISNRNGQADRHRSLLKAINAGRLADGGMAWGGSAAKIPRNIRQSLSLDADMSASQIREEYREFRRVLREAGIDLPKNFDKMREKSLELAERFDKVSKRVEKTELALEKWQETAENISTSVRSIFNNNPYGINGGGLANAMLQLEADRNDTAERNSLLQGVAGIAQSLGLDLSSEAFQSIATGADMQTLRDLDTGGDVQAIFDLFASRLQEQNAAGDFAATAVTGAHIASLEATQERLLTTVDNLTKQMERQEAQLERAAAKGTQDGAREGSREGIRMAWSDQERVKTAKAKTR